VSRHFRGAFLFLSPGSLDRAKSIGGTGSLLFDAEGQFVGKKLLFPCLKTG